MGATKFVFRTNHFYLRIDWGPYRRLAVDYNGTYPSLDAGLTSFLFDDKIHDQHQVVELGLPAARVPTHFGKRLLEAALADGKRYPVALSFVAVYVDLAVELEDFKRYASEPSDATIIYEVPQSPASDMLLELKIISLEGAPNNWKLVEFRRCKTPSPSIDGDNLGEGNGGCIGGDGFSNDIGGSWG